MKVRMFGGLEFTGDAGPVSVRGRRQGCLFVRLALSAGKLVTVPELLDAVWGEAQTADPRNALQAQISLLRRKLRDAGDEDVIRSAAAGYLLAVAPEEVDVLRFEQLVSSGLGSLEAHDHHGAARAFEQALALYVAPPWSGLDEHGSLARARARMDELRVSAIEHMFDAEWALGRRPGLPELERHASDHPLREGLQARLMLALYESDRQVEALQVFERTRRSLAEELGVDPGEELRRRHESILRQDERLFGEVDGHDVLVREVQARPPGSVEARLPAATNLPRPPTSLVGRDRDVEHLVRRLRSTRLLTLTGPGGVGKTRLAIEVASRVSRSGVAPDGVWMVELADIDAAELVAERIAGSLGSRDPGAHLSESTGSDRPETVERVVAHLRSRRALLVLDNAEHLLDGVGAVVDRLAREAADVTVLCTSREAIGTTFETVWAVPSLGVPPGTPAAPSELEEYDGTSLFLERVRANDPAFELGDTTSAQVAEICRRLDGIPLAIELAAARVRSLGVEAVATSLDDRFTVLARGDRTVLPRQRTLRATVDWSWDLLDEDERKLFAELSVFAGGADLDGIRHVCTDLAAAPSHAIVVDLLGRLVDKSLLMFVEDGDTRRYRMLESLRAYGRERLSERRAELLMQRYTRWVHHRAQEFAPALRTAGQIEALHQLDRILDDIRATLWWYRSTGRLDEGARLAGGLGWYWYLRGLRWEGLHWSAEFRAATDPAAAALVGVWWAFRSLGLQPLAETREVAAAAVEPLRSTGDRGSAAWALLVCAYLALVDGDCGASGDFLRQARGLAEQGEDRTLQATEEFVTAVARLAEGDHRGAVSRFEHSLAGFVGVGDRWGQAQCAIALLGLAELSGELTRAEGYARLGLEVAAPLGMPELEMFLHHQRARLRASFGAETEATRSEDLARGLASDLRAMAAPYVEREHGPQDDVSVAQEQARAWYRRAGVPEGLAYTLGHISAPQLLAELDVRSGDHALRAQVAGALEVVAATMVGSADGRDAACLLGAAAALRGNAAVERSTAGRAALDHVRRELGDTALEALLRQGAAEPPAATLARLG